MIFSIINRAQPLKRGEPPKTNTTIEQQSQKKYKSKNHKKYQREHTNSTWQETPQHKHQTPNHTQLPHAKNNYNIPAKKPTTELSWKKGERAGRTKQHRSGNY